MDCLRDRIDWAPVPISDPSTRRQFIAAGGAAAAAMAVPGAAQPPPPGPPAPAPEPAAPLPPGVGAATIAEAEKLAAVEFTEAERAQVLLTIGEEIERYRGRRAVELPNDLAPATVFRARLPGTPVPAHARLVPSRGDPGPLPADDESIAYAPVHRLSKWIERGSLTSARLTSIYLERLKRIGPRLECLAALTETRALAEAARADEELRAGRRRGPLHGIPWGAKDLFDTAGTATCWGAEPYRGRVPQHDAMVVRRLEAAGCVLAAKLSLGALAYGDRWYGGRTRNPWKPDTFSNGSSAGSAAAAAAGLAGFTLGTETLGSIVSPCMRCGTTGLRPTFGRVSRQGAMSLCWSLDKVGPIARSVEDCALVLAAINGPDDRDPSCVNVPLDFDANRPASDLKVGYAPAWFEDKRASPLDRAALEALRRAGLQLVEVELPDWPWRTLLTILFVEAAAAFEELTLSNRDDELSWQDPDAWPNAFRQTRFAPAIEYVQAQRFRRKVCAMMQERFDPVHAMISPSYGGHMLLITNSTGHPSLTLPCGLKEDGTPHGITLWGRLFDEGTLCAIGLALEKELAFTPRPPPP
jgi:Asp-tRNA(Asn)/Glu-tRNA(Gln) amidotransferase A subunit family amidase